MSKALTTTLIIADLHSDSRTGRKVIESLTKHDNCFNYYQYLHSTLSAFSQGTVLSQLSMMFFNEFDSFNIRTTFVKPQDYRWNKHMQQQVEPNMPRYVKMWAASRHSLASTYFHCIPLKVSSRWNYDLKKKHTVAKFRPSLPSSSSTHGFSRASPKEQHERYSTGKKRNEHSAFLKHDTTQFLHPRALAQMQFQIVSNPVCINIIL